MAEQAIHLALAAILARGGRGQPLFRRRRSHGRCKKTDPARMETVLYVTAEVVRRVAHPAASRSCRARPPSCSTCWRCRRTGATFADARRRPTRWCRARRCRRPSRCFRATSSEAGMRRRLTPMLVDSHCHLDFPDFAEERDGDRRARRRGRRRPHGDDLDPRDAVSSRCWRSPRPIDEVYCSVGTHPHNAAEEPDVTADDLVRLAAHPKVVAIGEAGLDYYYDNAPREAQAQGFRTHIAAARETGLPLVIHARDADDDMAAILEEETGKGAFPFILHCFSSGRAACRDRRRARRLRVLLRHPDLQELRASCAPSPPTCRATACWSRPTRPIWRRCRIAASATSRPMSSTRPRCWPRRSASAEAEIARSTTDNFFRLFTKMPASGAAERLSDDRPAALHDPRLRLVAGHAAHHRRLGRLRSGQAEEPAHPRCARWSSASRRTAAAPRVVIDTGPDFREQMLAGRRPARSTRSSTRMPHADHIHGIDDLRGYVLEQRQPDRHPCRPADAAPAAGGVRLLLRDAARQFLSADRDRRIPSTTAQPVVIEGEGGALTLEPLPQIHGDIISLGFRIGGAGLLPRRQRLSGGRPPQRLRGLDVLVIDALQYRTHPSHLSLGQALDWIATLSAAERRLTHMHVPLDYATVVGRNSGQRRAGL